MQTIKPSTVTVVSDNNGRTHMVITLELNITLNTNGIPASLGAAEVSPAAKKSNDDDFSGFEIPEFSTTEKINFGKKVEE